MEDFANGNGSDVTGSCIVLRQRHGQTSCGEEVHKVSPALQCGLLALSEASVLDVLRAKA